jgi:hypothetical protein
MGPRVSLLGGRQIGLRHRGKIGPGEFSRHTFLRGLHEMGASQRQHFGNVTAAVQFAALRSTPLAQADQRPAQLRPPREPVRSARRHGGAKLPLNAETTTPMAARITLRA